MEKVKAIYIGEVIKGLRKEKGIIQVDLALNSKLNRTYTGELERNEKAPSLLTIFDLAMGLGITPDQLVKEINDTIDFNRIFKEED